MEYLFFVLRFAINAIPFVFAILLPLIFYFCLIRFYQNPIIGVGSVIWIFVIETAIVIQPSLPLGIQLFIPDILFALIGAAGLFRAFEIQMQKQHYAWLVFGLVLLSSFLLGILKHGTTAGVEFRNFFYFWSGIWYLMTFQLTADQFNKIIRIYMAAAAVMVILAVLRWLAMALGMEIVQTWNEGGTSLRVFDAAQTYFLGQAFMIGLYAYLNKTGENWWRTWLPIMFICIVILQHRTVWAITFVSIALIFLLAGNVRSKATSTFALATVLGIAILLPLATGGQLDTVQSSLEHSVKEVGQEKSTIAWRTQSWQALVSQWAHSGPVVNLIGNPFGAGFSRHIELLRNELTQNPHSHYVYALMRVGLIGIIAMLSVYYMALRNMWKNRFQPNQKLVDAKLLIILMVGQLMYFISYAAHYSHLLPLGFSMVFLGQLRREASTSFESKACHL